MGEGARFALGRRSKITGKKGHGFLQAAPDTSAAPAVVHPGATPFGGSGIEVEVEVAHGVVAAMHPKDLDILVPDGGRGEPKQRPDLHPKEGLHHSEEPREHTGQREILSDLFFREGVPVLAQLLTGMGDVPGLQGLKPEGGLCEGPKFSEIFFCAGSCL